MGDEKLFWNQHIHFIESSGKVPINLSGSISGTFMTLAWDLLRIFRKKKYNLKGHCRAVFIAFIYFLIFIVCRALLNAGRCNSALLHLPGKEFCFLSAVMGRDGGRVGL